jgi:hypothetical protein
MLLGRRTGVAGFFIVHWRLTWVPARAIEADDWPLVIAGKTSSSIGPKGAVVPASLDSAGGYRLAHGLYWYAAVEPVLDSSLRLTEASVSLSFDSRGAHDQLTIEPSTRTPFLIVATGASERAGSLVFDGIVVTGGRKAGPIGSLISKYFR